ncbi:MAG TPA: hypothetical protein DCY13_09140 [Verrucomicrobiales bacterium]|nr:hypothetical protein [Verrucomicrobiales bacterium]
MNLMNDQRLFDLAMKVIAQQATEAERAELDRLLTGNPELRADFERLTADVRATKEALPLVNATQATGAEMPAYARERLQTKVRKTLGRPKQDTSSGRKPGWNWRWALGLAAVAVALLVFVLIPGDDEPIVQIALLDTAGATRGSNTNELATFQQVWPAAAVETLTHSDDLPAWEVRQPSGSTQPFAKIIYDRAAGEIRVVGQSKEGARFQQNFPVDTNLVDTLGKVDQFVRQRLSNNR